VSEPDRFRRTLVEARVVHVDASVFGLHLTGDERYVSLTRSLLSSVASSEFEARTSAITLYQLLVEPYRTGREAEAATIDACLSALSDLEIVPVTAAIARQAAQVRAQIGGSVERAIQIATALSSDAELFVTQRSALRRIAGLGVEQLDSYAGPADS
jgi:predicted nucleic acid-binding protein